MENEMAINSDVDQLNASKSISVKDQLNQINQPYSLLGDLLKDMSVMSTKVGYTVMLNAVDSTFKSLGSRITEFASDVIKLQNELDLIMSVKTENAVELSKLDFGCE